MRQCYRATAPSLEHPWGCPREELRRAPDELAVKAAAWFFERFNWHEVSQGVLSQIQARLFSGR